LVIIIIIIIIINCTPLLHDVGHFPFHLHVPPI